MAERIVINAKCQRPSVCNAAESLLIHEEVAPTFLPRVAAALRSQGVELRGCESTRRLVAEARQRVKKIMKRSIWISLFLFASSATWKQPSSISIITDHIIAMRL